MTSLLAGTLDIYELIMSLVKFEVDLFKVVSILGLDLRASMPTK